MKKIMLITAAILLTGCESLPTVTGAITDAQMNVLKAQVKEEVQASKDLDRVVGAIEKLAVSGDTTTKVMSLMILNQTYAGLAAARANRQPVNNDGPITAAFKAVAPYVIPGLQIWASDRAGGRALKESFGNMNLIGTIAKDIQRDPLIVNNPAPQVVQLPGAPAPQVIQVPSAPILIPPFVVDQPVIVTVPGQ